MRREVAYAGLCGELLNYVPGELLGHALAPSLASTTDAAEHLSRFNARGPHPRPEFAIDPIWNRDGPDVSALAAQVYYRPMSLPLLEMINSQLCRFVTPQPARKQEG